MAASKFIRSRVCLKRRRSSVPIVPSSAAIRLKSGSGLAAHFSSQQKKSSSQTASKAGRPVFFPRSTRDANWESE